MHDRERPRTPQAIFDRVAPYYDALNSVLSLGMDRRWRRRAVAALSLAPGARVLDVATGTGTVLAEIVRVTAGSVSATGCDVNEQMLEVARRRMRGVDVELVRCDATRLPFGDESFDAATLAFAIDDMPDRDRCIQEVHRVLRPSGQLAILELGQPDAPPLRAAYRMYLRAFRLVGFGGARGYRHLEEEIVAYRGVRAIESLLARGGFGRYRRASLTFGIARLHVAEKEGGSRHAVS